VALVQHSQANQPASEEDEATRTHSKLAGLGRTRR
jgi:hypothetical protein